MTMKYTAVELVKLRAGVDSVLEGCRDDLGSLLNVMWKLPRTKLGVP